jgi:3-isopropylmalate dehydrogenase
MSVAMLLDHIGETEAAMKVEAAVAADLKSRRGERSTSQIGDSLASLAGS